MNKENIISYIEKEDSINLKAELEKYFTHWKWFVLAIILALTGAYLYLRYATPKYKSSTTILIKNDKKGGLSEQLAPFEDFGITGNSSKNIDNEIEILKSRKIIKNVVNKLHLNIFYLVKGAIKKSEIYKDSPIKIVFYEDSLLNKIDTTFNIHILSNQNFELRDANKNLIGKYSFDTNVHSDKLGSFKILNLALKKKITFKDITIRNIVFNIKPINKVIDFYIKKIYINPVSKKSSVLKVSLVLPLKLKSKYILDELINEYNKEAVSDKNKVSIKTNDFITKRLSSVRKELTFIDNNIRNFKTKNKLTDINSEAKIILETGTENRQKIVDINTQLRLVKFLNDELNSSSINLLPSNLGLEDVNIGKSIVEYNQLVLQRNKLLKSAGVKNTMVIDIQESINHIRASLKKSLQNRETTLAIILNQLNKEETKFNSKIASIPTKEKEFLDIKRQQKIKANLYSYLLKKKEETSISLAITEPNAKIIDRAYSSNNMVYPKREIVYLIALLLGLLIPFAIIYLKNLLDTKIYTKKDIEKQISIPFLGDIPSSETKEKIIINANARSSSAEAFRLIRTNLDFILSSNDKNKAKIIGITSTIAGEGKSFVSVNLAATLALFNKKVLLIGMDLRAPKILEYLGKPNLKGVSNFITNNDLTLNSVKFTISEIKGLDIISSGIIPPNPTELLVHKRVKELFDTTKNDYDYVLVDTAPVGLVADTLLIAKYTDMFIYITRANYLDKKMLTIPETLYKEQKLPNMALILNDVRKANFSYGYGYGGEAKKKESWYKKIVRCFYK